MFNSATIATIKPEDAIVAGATELLIANLNTFNEDSGGAINLTSKVVTQAIQKSPFLKLGANPIDERNPATATGNFPSAAVSLGENKIYRLHRLIKELLVDNHAMKDWLKQNFAVGPQGQFLQSNVQETILGLRGFGSQIAGYILQDIRNTAITSLSAAIGSETGLVYSGGTLTSPVKAADVNVSLLNNLRSVRGDAKDNITTFLMHSATERILNNDVMLNRRGFSIQDTVLGQRSYLNVAGDFRYIVCDDPALVSMETIGGSSVPVYRVLGLERGAANISMDEILMQAEVGSAGHNLNASIKGTYDLDISIKGFELKSSVTAQYTKAKLGAVANWDKTVAQDKATAGVQIYHRI